ncbi:CsbD family protein [Brachybacterium halotolerans subsp. kimchii]|uniref:CsbD family protein n=1 Tax=Brachybacterium TaxID=43668 RepID=UPI001E434F63|nr:MULTISPECIES: CsbD family protein [Brachybacterium]MCG7309743.1 CsbD family protein [Brachybacterium sp. ACRRE]UEJ83870.1 CsbD family protein [Brachybacterium halotolerans subsp. kimchii]
MSADEKFENTADQLGGKAKEGLGKLTGDKEAESEGKVQQARAGLEDKVQDVKDSVKGALNGLTGKKDGE